MTKPTRRAALCLTVAFLPFLLPAQTPPAPAPTMKQLMLDLIHPASNDIILIVSRAGPSDDKDWASVRHSALTLMDAGNDLLARRPASSDVWVRAAKMLADAGSAAYKAAQAKNAKALPSITIRIDASCTDCHKQYRPNVFPPQGAAQ